MDPKMSASDLFKTLEDDVSSCSADKRLAALTRLNKCDTNPWSIFKLCLEAEKIVLTSTNFRQKLHLIQALQASKVKSLKNDLYMIAALRFLFGSLYVNFTPLWKDILELIRSFVETNQEDVRKISIEKLIECQEWILKEVEGSSVTESDEKPAGVEPTIEDVKRNRPDFLSYRINLLTLLSKCSFVLEPIGDQFLNIFFKVIGDNALESDKTFLKKSENKDSKTIVAFLQVLANFSNINNLKSVDELKLVINQYLISGNATIQESALNVLILIHSKDLKRYKPQLARLVSEKTFREQLTELNINAINHEDRAVQNDHRDKVVPHLMRLLAGKMNAISQKGSKATTSNNRDIILRFIAGCPVPEIQFFFDLNLAQLKPFISLEYPEMMETLLANESFHGLSVHKLKESLKFLESALEHFVNIAQDMLPIVIKYILAISLTTASRISRSKSDKISDLKELRKDVLKILSKLFQDYDHHDFTEFEVTCIFSSIVEPVLRTFAIDSIGNTTPFLDLVTIWSENSKFFHLLDRKSGPEATSSIQVLMQVFQNDKTSNAVHDAITQILANLLQLDTFESMETTETESKPVETKTDGIDLVKPFVTQILSQFEVKFHKMRNEKKMRIKTQELLIVRKLVDVVHDPGHCRSLALLLVEIFRRQHFSAIDSHEEFLETIHSLALKSGDAKSDLNLPMAPLFSQVTPNSSRTKLCDIVLDISNESNKPIVDGLVSINSFSPKYVDEPDYERRLDGFKSLEALIENGGICGRDKQWLGILHSVIYTCIYSIQNFVLDMSIRESSAALIEKIVEAASKDKMVFKNICEKVLLAKGVKQLMRCETEAVRMEAITVILPILKHGKGTSQVIDGLALLSDKEEPEVDFWLNVKHVQAHRRTRAFGRLASDHLKLSQIGHQVLWSYILPLPMAYLKTVDNSQVGPNTAAIDLIGSICRFTDWSSYESLLKQFLRRLKTETDSHNIIVRVISSILSNFNFDISDATAEDLEIPNVIEIVTPVTNGDSEPMESTIADPLKQKLSPEKASLILKVITTELLPELNKCLHELNYADFDHDRMKKEFDEDGQVQRIPIAIAMVKLLMVLPPKFKILESHIQGIFLRLCHFLRSKAVSIRDTARKSIRTVMRDLGVTFLPFLLKEMNHSLTRGYQRHVLSYSVNDLIAHMLPNLEPGDLDSSCGLLSAICASEITGEVGQEKEVDKIVGKTKEAKKKKAFDLLAMMGQLASPSIIPDLVSPLRSKLLQARTFKEIKSISEAVHKLFLGFVDNKSLEPSTLLALVFGTVTDNSILDTDGKKSTPANPVKKIKSSRLRQDSLLINRQLDTRIKSKTTGGNYNHVLVEKGFLLLNCLLDKNKLVPSNSEHLKLLDPFVAVIASHLTSKQTSVVVVVLKCLHHLITNFGTNLPSFTTHGVAIKNRLFILISHNNAIGVRDGENGEVSKWCFKNIGQIIRGFDGSVSDLNEDQLQVIMTHIEQGLLGDSGYKVATFALLKSILGRRLESPILAGLMERVAHLAIQSETDHIRKHCWQSSLRYLLFYPHGAKLNSHLLFWIKQIEYEFESGRRSALELIHGLVKNMSQKQLQANQYLLLIPLSVRLVNEDSVKCKNKVHEVILELMSRISSENRSNIYKQLILSWLSNADMNQRRVAIHLCSTLVEIEGSKFESRLGTFIPLFLDQLNPVHYKQVTESSIEDQAVQSTTKQADQFLFCCLSLLEQLVTAGMSMSQECRSPQGSTTSCALHPRFKRSPFNDIWPHVVSVYLKYPHVWVRFMATKLIGHLFSCYTHQEVAERIWKERRKEIRRRNKNEISCREGGDQTKIAENEDNEEEENPGEKKTHEKELEGQENEGKKEEEKKEEENEEKEFLLSAPWTSLPFLTKRFFFLLDSTTGDLEALSAQVLNNLSFVADVIVYLHLKQKEEKVEGVNEKEGEEKKEGSSMEKRMRKRKDANGKENPGAVCEAGTGGVTSNCNATGRLPHGLELETLLSKIERKIKLELKWRPQDTLARTAMFKLIAKIASCLDPESLDIEAERLILPLYREVTDGPSNRNANASRQSLVTLAQQVLDVLDTVLGPESFRRNYTKAQVTLRSVRVARKKQRALVMAHDPTAALAMRQRKNLSKKRAKKRKAVEMTGNGMLGGRKRARTTAPGHNHH